MRRYTKARSKVALCPGDTLGKEGIGRCPFAKLIDLNTLPSFLGGQCRCKGGCICHTPNEQSTQVARAGADGMTSAAVAARDKLEVFVGVDAGDRVVWQVQVEARGVEVSVVLRSGGSSTARPTTLVAPFKHKAADGRREDMVTAPAKGTLVVVFDNSSSYLNSKSIKYRIETLTAVVDRTEALTGR